jgi:hypothetical protein
LRLIFCAGSDSAWLLSDGRTFSTTAKRAAEHGFPAAVSGRRGYQVWLLHNPTTSSLPRFVVMLV